ncbi:hypothetical protein ACWZHB_01110 [Nocardia sp. FBN12]|uniref:hypothetical protein n=1 Tax=Nocardia sp. FBN12 TaxID=3419766 RepID=UPI003D034323
MHYLRLAARIISSSTAFQIAYLAVTSSMAALLLFLGSFQAGVAFLLMAGLWWWSMVIHVERRKLVLLLERRNESWAADGLKEDIPLEELDRSQTWARVYRDILSVSLPLLILFVACLVGVVLGPIIGLSAMFFVIGAAASVETMTTKARRNFVVARLTRGCVPR